MNILALDTSSKASSVAVLSGNSLWGEYYLNAGLTHSQTALTMVEQLTSLLTSTGFSFANLDLLAVSHGPGSYTGIRIGVSAIKGIALGQNIPCVGVSTLEGLAYNLLPFSGLILPCLDARRESLFASFFRSDGTTLFRLEEDLNLPILDLLPLLFTHRQEGERVMLLGDGAELTAERLREAAPFIELAPPTLLQQRAGSVALAAKQIALQGGSIPSDQLVPVYLRMVQAQRERLDTQPPQD